MDKKLIAYIDQQLTPDEVADLEKRIARSPDLQKELHLLNDTLLGVRELSETPAMNNYFAEARGRLHAKIDSKRNRSTFSQYALAGGGAFSLSVMLFFGVATHVMRVDQANTQQTLASSSVMESISLEKGELQTAENIVTEDEPTTSVLDQKLAEAAGIKPENSDKIISDLNISTDDLVDALPGDAINNLTKSVR